MLKLSINTLQQVEKFKYLRWYSRVTENSRWIHGLAKQTLFYVKFIVPLSQNGNFQRPQSF